MARPKKHRKVCCLPENREFTPVKKTVTETPVVMTVEEYETIRLIDYRGFTQTECAGYMKVARSTVQHIYENARKKAASAMVESRNLRIEGGNYQLCNSDEPFCPCAGCWKHRQLVIQSEKSPENETRKAPKNNY